MIESIELCNFESHKRTKLENLSRGFNLICGASNSGKTSISRALRLISQGEYNPESIRVGEKNCSVEVITDKGRVKVTRGADHVWEVQPKNGETEVWKKIGKGKIPCGASEILGLSAVKLGDIEIPVNIMDQLEGHFMMSELDGKKATGSIRAQIIDEISGLSGIEGIIKDVSLDNYRWTKEVKQIESQIQEIEGQMHDSVALSNEKVLLDIVGDAIEECGKLSEVVELAVEMGEDFISLLGEIKAIDEEIKEIPDPTTVEDLIDVVSADVSRIELMREFCDKHERSHQIVNNLKGELKGQVDTGSLKKSIEEVSNMLGHCKVLCALETDINNTWDGIEMLEGDIERVSSEYTVCVENQKEILSSIKVCPLTQFPIENCKGVSKK